jgi:hypothetical protein
MMARRREGHRKEGQSLSEFILDKVQCGVVGKGMRLSVAIGNVMAMPRWIALAVLYTNAELGSHSQNPMRMIYLNDNSGSEKNQSTRI